MEILPHEKQIYEYLTTIEHLKKQNQDSPLFKNEIEKLEIKLEKLKQKVYSDLTPAERILIARHPSRPHALDYIKNICDSFEELHGDRRHGDDHAIVGGLAKIGDSRLIIIGQEKGHNTETRVYRNFGMVSPEGFRKAMRLMKLAEKFSLPVVSLVDTPGAYPGLEAEERGQGWAIAENLLEMSRLRTQMIVIIIGEGCSGGALGIAMGDVVAILQHAYYSVISPEGCASILWKDAAMNQTAAKQLKLNSEDLLKFKVVDAIIPEPLGGAHHDPTEVMKQVKKFLITQLDHLTKIPIELLLNQRYLKYRKIGSFEESNYLDGEIGEAHETSS